jgi:hypothetical protein
MLRAGATAMDEHGTGARQPGRFRIAPRKQACEPPHPKGSRASAGHRALEGALAGGPLREPRQVVPQVRREFIRKADALRESQRAPDKVRQPP